MWMAAKPFAPVTRTLLPGAMTGMFYFLEFGVSGVSEFGDLGGGLVRNVEITRATPFIIYSRKDCVSIPHSIQLHYTPNLGLAC